MKAALRLLLVTTTLVLAGPAFAEVLSTAKPETVDVSPNRLSRIRTVLQQEIDKRQMTIQDLFRHTAGFAYGEFSNVPEIKVAYAEAKLYQPGITAESRMITPDQFVTGIAKAPLVHEPGTTWEYSMSVDVLGRVVEAISGQRLSAFLDERLFRPLNMVDAGFKVPEVQWSRIAEPLPKNPLTGGAN